MKNSIFDDYLLDEDLTTNSNSYDYLNEDVIILEGIVDNIKNFAGKLQDKQKEIKDKIDELKYKYKLSAQHPDLKKKVTISIPELEIVDDAFKIFDRISAINNKVVDNRNATEDQMNDMKSGLEKVKGLKKKLFNSSEEFTSTSASIYNHCDDLLGMLYSDINLMSRNISTCERVIDKFKMELKNADKEKAKGLVKAEKALLITIEIASVVLTMVNFSFNRVEKAIKGLPGVEETKKRLNSSRKDWK